MKFILYVIVAGAVAACWASYLLRDGTYDVEGLRHRLVLLRRVGEQRPGVRGVIRTMLGGVSGASVFAFNLWVGSILVGPALAVGGLVAAIRPAGSGQRVLGVLVLSTGVLVTYVVGGVLLRRGARHFDVNRPDLPVAGVASPSSPPALSRGRSPWRSGRWCLGSAL